MATESGGAGTTGDETVATVGDEAAATGGITYADEGRRRGVVCEKLSRRLQEFGKKLLGVQRVKRKKKT